MSARNDYYTLKLILSIPEKLRMGLLGEKEIAVRGSALDPHLRSFFALLQKQGRQSIDDLGREHGASAARMAYQHFYRAGAYSARKAPVTTEDLMLAGADGEIPARLYRPNQPSTDGLFVYFHGGGGVIGDIDTYDYFNRYISATTGTTVLFPEYRLGPEHPFPAGVEDSIKVIKAAPKLTEKWGLDPKRIAIGGDSAGGMLTAITAHEAAVAGIDIKAIWLLFAAFDFETDYPSLEDYKEGFGLSKSMMEWFRDQYFAGGGDRADPLASAINLPHLEKLPKTLLRAAEYDPLFDQSPAFLKKIKPMGVDVTYRVAKGLVHGYSNMFGLIPAANKALDEDLAWVKAELSN